MREQTVKQVTIGKKSKSYSRLHIKISYNPHNFILINMHRHI